MGLKDFFFYWSKKSSVHKKNNKVPKRSPKIIFSRTEGANTGHRGTRERKMRDNGDSRMVFGKTNEAFEPIRVGFVALLHKFEEKCS